MIHDRRPYVALAFAIGCASTSTRPVDAPAASGAVVAPAPIQHVVICWLKPHGDVAARALVMAASEELRAIPGVVSVRAGVVIPSERAVVDSTFDLGLVIELEDAAALAAYAHHPIHQRFVREVLGPRLDRYVVYDLGPLTGP